MKNIIIIALFLFTSFQSFAQTDTSKVEQYAEIVATPRLLSNKVTIDIDYGEERSIWRDNRLKEDNGKLKKFNTTIDALNYMGRDGWKLVNAFPVSIGNSQVYHYVFKKSFSKSEISQ
ncbi:MAG: hypothetical protein JWO92_1593 [Chitinophagaceae bacterium]|nr:hypothetical protein [Chitinophagaceae bacterium]